jgi:hypothetical protein
MMAGHERSLAIRILRSVARFFVTVAVVGYTVLDELLFPLVRPVIRWLGRLQLFQLIAVGIARLPPYAVLVLLAVPFVIIEPIKVFAVYWGATGHVIQGGALLIVAHVVSILTCDRIYHSGHAQLMKIIWFARLMAWLVRLRDKAFTWARSTAAWRAASAMARSVRGWFRGILQALR